MNPANPHDISGAPRTITLAGRTLRLYPLTVGDWLGPYQDWIDRQQVDPFDIVSRQIERGRAVVRDGELTREPYTIAQQQFMLNKAIEQATRSRVLIGTEAATELMNTASGVMALLAISVRKGDPTFTEADAQELCRDLNLVEMGRIFRETQATLVMSDPKAEPGTTTPAGTTTLSSVAATPQTLRTGGKPSTRSPRDRPPNSGPHSE